MSGLGRILETPFSQLGLEQQLLVVFVLLCCAALAIYAIAFAARTIRPTRLHKRQLVGRPVLISWRDGVGFRESDEGFCQDISVGGMALVLPFPLQGAYAPEFPDVRGEAVGHRRCAVGHREAAGCEAGV